MQQLDYSPMYRSHGSMEAMSSQPRHSKMLFARNKIKSTKKINLNVAAAVSKSIKILLYAFFVCLSCDSRDGAALWQNSLAGPSVSVCDFG